MVLSASYLQFNEVRTISQYYALTDQLNMGVRHLELDIHYFHGQFRMSHCGFSIGIVNYLFHLMENVLKWLNFKYDTDTIGCLPSFNGIPAEDQLLLRPVLEVVRQWMELPRNRDEILILYLDTSVNLIRWKKVEELVSIFQSVFGSLIIPPQPDLDFRRLLVQKKRLMIVSRRVYPGADSVFFSMDSAFTCQYPLFLQDIEKVCHSDGTVRRDRASLAGKSHQSVFYSRVVTNRLRYGPLSKDFLPSPSPVNIYDKNTLDLYALGFNTLAADYIDEELAGSHIWTWSRDLEVAAIRDRLNETCVAMEVGVPRWTVATCRETHRVLCRSAVNETDFVVGNYRSSPQLLIPLLHSAEKHTHVPVDECPFGYLFFPPISTYQQRFAQAVVNGLVNGTVVWIGFRLEEYYFL
ncbi:hypothetical protein WA588_004221 [Blastocystis sp. NMH]